MRFLFSLLTKPPAVTAVVVAIIATVSLTSGALVERLARNALHQEVRQHLVRLALIAALHIDGDQHSKWQPGDETSAAYQRAIAPLRRIRQADPDIDDIYTCVLKDGKVYFVLSSYDPGDSDGDGVDDKCYIEQPYEEATPEMLQALREGVAIAENRPYTDRWGTFLSGYAPIRDSSGQLVGIVGLDLHITRYQQYIQAIASSTRIAYLFVLLFSALIGAVVWGLSHRFWRAHQQLRLQARAMETAAYAIVITDRNGTILWVNPAFSTITGYARDEVIGGNPRLLKSGKHDRAFYTRMWQTILSGQVWKGEIVNRRKDGSLYSEEITIAPVSDEKGIITHFVAIKQDISERKWVEQQLEHALQRAQAASRAKSEFLANMSHEIRTPMNGILGMAQLLMGTSLNEEQQDYVTTLKNSAESLLALLGDILDISKIESGKMTLHYSPFDLDQVVSQVAHLFIARAKEKGITIEVHIDDDVPLQLLGDELRIRQILANLVGNAVKFTVQGSISISVRLNEPVEPEKEADIRQTFGVSSEHPVTWLRIAVSDTGIGIPADKHKDIFESFVQADGTTTRRHGGTGLGLAINRDLTQLMGGTIGVHSEEGKGSTFWVILPLFVRNMEQSSGKAYDGTPEQCSNMGTQHSRITAGAARRVLLVEDNEVNRKVAVRLLQKLGHEVDTAIDGAEAVEKTALHRYDAVLMDIHMPRMDGLEATRRIRERERSTGVHQVIIAMTANAMREDVEKCLSSGMDDYLSKPVKAEVLQAVLEKWQNALFESVSSNFPIDRDFLMEITDGDAEFAAEILQEFLDTTPSLLRQAEEALRAGDATSLTRAAHTIKGSARSVGAQAFADIAFALERAGKEQQIDTASEIVRKLHEEWQRVQEHIEQHFIRKAA